MTDLDTSKEGEPPLSYMIFILVFFFFLTGLLGFLICHMLKKKGYRCRTGDLEEEEEECKDKLTSEDGTEENQDTVEQILKCIIENEANMEAFKEMLGDQNTCEHKVASRLPRKESLGGLPPHHHTVHSVADRNSCHLCAQHRSKKARRRNRVPRSKDRPGEQTVFSVGRFRVTHMEKKNSLQGPANLQVNISGENLDHSEALDDESGKPQEGYNLRNMFKHVSPTNGAVAVETKRKKSVTLLAPWKSSDPTAMKKPQEPQAVMMEVVIDNDGDHPDSPEQPESSAQPLEEGTDTDVLTDSEMAGDKAPTSASGAHGGEDAGEQRHLVPAQMQEYSVVRTQEAVEDGVGPGDFGREDMMEMEDIKDCRVSLEEDSRPSREEKRRSVHSQHKW